MSVVNVVKAACVYHASEFSPRIWVNFDVFVPDKTQTALKKNVGFIQPGLAAVPPHPKHSVPPHFEQAVISNSCPSTPRSKNSGTPRSSGHNTAAAAELMCRVDNTNRPSCACRIRGHTVSKSFTIGITCSPYSLMQVISAACGTGPVEYFMSNRWIFKSRIVAAILWATVWGDPT